MGLRRAVVLSVAAIGSVALALPVTASASPSGVVISQLRLRTATSQYDEYVEIANHSGHAVDLSGWRLYDCYTAGGTPRVGADGDPLAAGTTLPDGRTFVFGKDRGDYSGVADVTYGYQVTEAGGFQLRDAGGTVQDGVGAPGTACAEGTGLTFPTAGADFTFTRTQDTDDNAADFDGPAGAADGTPCGSACAAPPAIVAIHDLQGSGATTPRSGQTATVSGVVVGVDNQEGVANYVDLDPRQAGMYVEAPAAEQDGDPATSEAIFVGGLSAAERAAAHVGQTVTVTGKVGELYNLTWLDATGHAADFGPAADLPAAVTIDPAQAGAQAVSSNGTRAYYESLEGMRVRLAVGTADSGGTNRFGELFLRPGTTRARVLRDPANPAGPADLLATAQDAGSAGVDPTNPSRNPDSTTRVNADLFATVRDVVGPLGFSFSQYKIVPQPGALPQVGDSPIGYPPSVPRAPLAVRVAQFNVENLFGVGMTDDGHTFTAEEVDAKTTRIADAIGHVLRRPDIVAVEEVADQAALEQVADKLGGYTAYWEPSTDARHISVGFLVRRGLVHVASVKQIGRDATTDATGCNDDGSGNPKTFERPPLELEVRARLRLRFTLIANHWGSQGHPEPCRQAQAQFVHDEVAALEAAGREVIVLGDLNDFEDSPALTQNLVGPGVTLANLWSLAPADDRYSYQYNGQLQTLDHIFATDGLRARVRDMRYVHIDNDYYERDDTHTAAGVSDHDAALATFSLLPRLGGGR